MKIVTTIMSIILSLAIIAGAAWLTLTCVKTFDQATEFRTMNLFEKGKLFMTDNERYNEMSHSYEIVTSILGE